MPDEDDEAEKQMESVKHKFELEISERMLHDQVTAAIEGGVNYWARVDVGEHQAGWRNYLTASFYPTEAQDRGVIVRKGKRYQLSIEKLLAGLRVLAEKYPRHFAAIMDESGDATTGEVLVQCAIFGDIVFG